MDPLLREDWRAAESRRARGLAARVSRLLEKPGGSIIRRDKDNRVFKVALSGRVSFNPRDDNWKRVVPRLSQADLHLVEARALYKIGARREAFLIWKSLIAMARYSPTARAFVRQAAREAAVDLNRTRANDSDFEDLDRRSEPFVYYDDDANVTLLLSDVYGFRVKMPGLWLFRPGGDVVERKGDLKEQSAFLKRGKLKLRVSVDAFSRAFRVPVVPGYLSLWDRRRTLSRQRMIMFRFRRGYHLYHNRYCARGGLPGEKSRKIAYPRVRRAGDERFVRTRDCLMLESTLFANGRARAPDPLVYRFENDGANPPPAVQGRRYNFIEFYLLRRFRGFFLEMRHPTDQKEAADIAMEAILKTFHVSAD